VIDTTKLEPAGRASLAMVDGHPDYLDRGACAHTRQVTHPAIGVCEQCTALVSLERWTNQCDQCGAEYNGEGQRLADRALWGTETNEHPADLGRLA
jgi:predicted amidophosphoribosyltransferase